MSYSLPHAVVSLLLPGLRLTRQTCRRNWGGPARRRCLSSSSKSPPQLFFDEASQTYDFGDYSVILPPDPPVFGVSHIEQRNVPSRISRPPYARNGLSSGSGPSVGDGRIQLGSVAEERLRRSAKLAKRVLTYAGCLVKDGVTTNDIDLAVHDYIIGESAYPSPLRYSGFPKSCCTSVNNIIVHGIPDEFVQSHSHEPMILSHCSRPLQNGDIVNIDVTVYLDGYHGDTSRTFLVGDVDDLGQDLVDATSDALDAGIAACGPGRPFKSIGQAVHKLAAKRGYSVSSEFSGHGIGKVFHRSPWILHHRNDEPGIMLPGHCFTIEPSLIQGPDPHCWIWPDGWTASTEVRTPCPISSTSLIRHRAPVPAPLVKNGARSAQKEHMVLITEHGVDVLTA
ncbi:Creatinase/aminopeptidase [Artomyces pyxidatus]|uniref:Creatinase/aminopeptidase n=1 Tax=Artomyces pyxidatus TaxID=48021 RepID=A0ACB8TJ89_9AGAM|nr:Creatinase/aminopeptidase [Artomyces pyxidatus]